MHRTGSPRTFLALLLAAGEAGDAAKGRDDHEEATDTSSSTLAPLTTAPVVSPGLPAPAGATRSASPEPGS